MMKPADLAGLPVRVGAAVRGARLFHPEGVLATGTVHRIAAADAGLPLVSGDVVARVSKGVGTPGGFPDVLGLAFRMDPHSGDQTPWDVLLASALGGAGLATLVPCPVRSLSDATFTTLQPLDHRAESWWLRARLAAQSPDVGTSLATIKKQIDESGLVFDIEQARFSTPFLPLARLTLTDTVSETDYPGIGFDPTVNTTRGVRPGPGWLREARAIAYRQSRKGRR